MSSTIIMIMFSMIFLVGAVLYSSLIGVDYLATFFNNPFNVMFLGLGIPAISIGIGFDIVDYIANLFKKKDQEIK